MRSKASPRVCGGGGMLRNAEDEGRRSVPPRRGFCRGAQIKGARSVCPGKTGRVCHLCSGTQQRATQHHRPPRIRPYSHPAGLTPLSRRSRRRAEAEARGEAGDGGRSGAEGSIKERRRALISPWPPSLDLLHSGRRDEMKSNGEGERASEQRTIRGRGGGQTSCQVSSAFKLVSRPLQ